MFIREFVLGNNQTGLVIGSGGSVSVVGGEDATLAAPALPGQLGIFQGSGTTQFTYTFPSATIAAWNSFYANVTAATSSTSGAVANAVGSQCVLVAAAVVAAALLW